MQVPTCIFSSPGVTGNGHAAKSRSLGPPCNMTCAIDASSVRCHYLMTLHVTILDGDTELHTCSCNIFQCFSAVKASVGLSKKYCATMDAFVLDVDAQSSSKDRPSLWRSAADRLSSLFPVGRGASSLLMMVSLHAYLLIA